jgi:hypothetical protein
VVDDSDNTPQPLLLMLLLLVLVLESDLWKAHLLFCQGAYYLH